MFFNSNKIKITISIPTETEYRTFLKRIRHCGDEQWCAQKREWWWPFWHTIGLTKEGYGDLCYSEKKAMKVCIAHARWVKANANGQGNGTFLGVYKGK